MCRNCLHAKAKAAAKTPARKRSAKPAAGSTQPRRPQAGMKVAAKLRHPQGRFGALFCATRYDLLQRSIPERCTLLHFGFNP
jgi:hypothetical protein